MRPKTKTVTCKEFSKWIAEGTKDGFIYRLSTNVKDDTLSLTLQLISEFKCVLPAPRGHHSPLNSTVKKIYIYIFIWIISPVLVRELFNGIFTPESLIKGLHICYIVHLIQLGLVSHRNFVVITYGAAQPYTSNSLVWGQVCLEVFLCSSLLSFWKTTEKCPAFVFFPPTDFS